MYGISDIKTAGSGRSVCFGYSLSHCIADWLSAPRSFVEPVRRRCVSWVFARWNTVRRSKGCRAPAAVRETVRMVNDDHFRRLGRLELAWRRGRDGCEEPLNDNDKS